jgi:GMP synthase (glutamine-hydrolysing)
VFEKNLPVLGICYGMQALAHQLGGKVAPAERREYGHAVVHQGDIESPIFAGVPASIPVWMSHGDRIMQMPPGFQSIAYSDNSPMAAMSNGGNVVALQFHPEVVHTPHGKQIWRTSSTGSAAAAATGRRATSSPTASTASAARSAAAA